MNAVAAPARRPVLRYVRRHGWTGAVWLLVAILLAWYTTLIPNFGAFEVATIVKSGLPLAFLALAQGVIVLSGGIDLSVGALMVLSNCVAARLMEGQPAAATLGIGAGILVGSAVLNGVQGWVIHRSRVPDIVVTLAVSYMYAGLALLVLPSPGGGTSELFRIVFTGSEFGIGTNWVPSLIAVIVPTAGVWYLLRRTRTGLSLYAVGSDSNAAYLSGVRTGRAKIIAYGVGGLLSGLAGLAITAITGAGEPRFSIGANATLNSVAAVVLGGIALTGGVGSPIGALAAGYALYLLSPILTSLGVDPNTSQVVQGVLIVLVVMGAGLLELRRRRRM